MKTLDLEKTRNEAFISQIARESGQNLLTCYQCGNCTAGCPCNFAYDVPVSRIMRYVQAGQKEHALSCQSIWRCLSCSTCSIRCPNNIDVARVMEALRHMARREGYVKDYPIAAFHNAFLDSIRRNGRGFELGIMVNFVMRTGRAFSDMDIAPIALLRTKLGLRPHRVKNLKAVAEIFKRYKESQ